MSARRLLALLLALVVALSLLSGCSTLRDIRENMLDREDRDDDDDDRGTDAEDILSDDLFESSGAADFGEVVSDGKALYYWRYTMDSFDSPATFANYSTRSDAETALVKRTGGKETVLLTANGTGSLCLADGRLYYTQILNDDAGWRTELCSVDLKGENPSDHAAGRLMGVSDDGAYVFATGISDSSVLCVHTDTQETETLTTGEVYFCASHDDTAYYEVFDYSGDDPALELYALRVGEEPVRICHETQTGFASVPSVAEMRFTDIDGVPYVYFSYGPVEGSGAFYQGGRIARARADGSDFEVLAGETESVFSDFIVQPDGSITLVAANDRISEGLYGGMTGWYTKDGEIFAIEQSRGESVKLLGSDGYAEFSSLSAGQTSDDGQLLKVASAEVHGDDAYVRLERSSRDSGYDIGWREGYALEAGTLLHVSLKTGAVETLYTYSD